MLPLKLLAITGGAQGIGRAVAFRFAKAGYAVSIADQDEDAGLEAVHKVVAWSVFANNLPMRQRRIDDGSLRLRQC